MIICTFNGVEKCTNCTFWLVRGAKQYRMIKAVVTLIINNGDCSVYVHINKINGKVYVGRTKRKPEDRYGMNGSCYLRRDKNSGKYLQPLFANAIKKYGWDKFEHDVVASNLTEKESRNFEKLLIKALRSNEKEFGYNMTEGGEDLSNLWSDERKIIHSNNRKISVRCIELDQSFETLGQAVKATKISSEEIKKCCWSRVKNNRKGKKDKNGNHWEFIGNGKANAIKKSLWEK